MPKPTLEKKPKMRLRKRHIKKAAIITVYTFVAVVMVVGMIAPALQ
jgi:hypothetical protein